MKRFFHPKYFMGVEKKFEGKIAKTNLNFLIKIEINHLGKFEIEIL